MEQIPFQLKIIAKTAVGLTKWAGTGDGNGSKLFGTTIIPSVRKQKSYPFGQLFLFKFLLFNLSRSTILTSRLPP